MENPKQQPDEEGFVKPNPRSRANKKQGKASAGINPEAQNKTEGQDEYTKEEKGDQDKEIV